MIPPEPEPEPPVPEPTSDYTYASHSTVPVGPYTADFYTAVKDSNDVQCLLRGVVNNSNVYLGNLLVVDVTAFDQVNYYISSTDKSIMVYTDNASLGGTHPYYRYDSTNGDIVEAGTISITDCVPSDFFAKIDSGDFTLEERQSSKGVLDESDLYYY